MRSYLQLGPPAQPPQEYIDFTLRRAMWQEMGLRYDDMTARDAATYALFMRLENEKRERERKH